MLAATLPQGHVYVCDKAGDRIYGTTSSLLRLGLHWSEAERDVHVIVHQRGFEKEPQEYGVSSDNVQMIVYSQDIAGDTRV